MATYTSVTRPALEYASSIWSPLPVTHNSALRTVTGCAQDTNIQHMHDEILILPIHEHLELHASQYKQKTQHQSHPLHKHTTYFKTPRLKKTLIFNNVRYTVNITTEPHTINITDIKTCAIYNYKIQRTPPPHNSSTEEILPRITRRTLA